MFFFAINYFISLVNTIKCVYLKKIKDMKKTLSYWEENGEEDYKTTPISVLKYISELEKLNSDLVENTKGLCKSIENIATETLLEDKEIEILNKAYSLIK